MENKLVSDELFLMMQEHCENNQYKKGGAIVVDEELKEMMYNFWESLFLDETYRRILIDREFSDYMEAVQNPFKYIKNNDNSILDDKAEFVVYKNNYDKQRNIIISIQIRNYRTYEVERMTHYLRLDISLRDNLKRILKVDIEETNELLNDIQKKKEELELMYEKL